MGNPPNLCLNSPDDTDDTKLPPSLDGPSQALLCPPSAMPIVAGVSRLGVHTPTPWPHSKLSESLDGNLLPPIVLSTQQVLYKTLARG